MVLLERLKRIGPGAMVAAAFIGPGTVTTATIAGASFGYTLLWAILFSLFATWLLQEMSARLGVIAQIGVGEALRLKFTGTVAKFLSSFLVIGAILIGNAAYEAGNLSGAVIGFEGAVNKPGWIMNPLLLIVGVAAFIILYSGKYRLIEGTLVSLVSLMGIVFIATAIMVQPDLESICRGLFIPRVPDKALLVIIGLIGTTVVPYNLFLHASTAKEKWSGQEDLNTSRWDTFLSVGLGGLITMAIVIAAAGTFEGSPGQVEGASDLAIQLKPLLGEWSGNFIAFGFLAAGFSSAVTAPLAASYASSEILGWKEGMKGFRFRMVWIFVLLSGLVFANLDIRPTAIIFFAQVANGFLLPIIAAFLVWIMNEKEIMGRFVNHKAINVLSLIVILVTIGLGVKGIISALQIL